MAHLLFGPIATMCHTPPRSSLVSIRSVACLIFALAVRNERISVLAAVQQQLHPHPAVGLAAGPESGIHPTAGRGPPYPEAKTSEAQYHTADTLDFRQIVHHDSVNTSEASSSGPIYWWVKPRREAPTWITQVEAQDPDLLPSLSPAGKKIRRVLIYSLVGGTCRSDDWRGALPRYLIRYLADARAVMIDASPSMHRNNWTCSECRHDTDPHFWDQRTDCEHYFGEGPNWSKNPADMVVVFGAGSYMPCGEESPLDESCKPWRDKSYDLQLLYPDLNALFTSGLITNETLKIHIPIRKTHYLNEHPIFPFHHILADNEFLKPLSEESFDNMQEICEGTERGPDLIYIGRFKSSKGQLEFLEAVDPKHLKGYTVHFHGATYYHLPYLTEMNRVARAKGIEIVIHPFMEKEELYSRYCRSAGQIHYSHGDNVSTAALLCSIVFLPLLPPSASPTTQPLLPI